jgi:hypothetical protein
VDLDVLFELLEEELPLEFLRVEEELLLGLLLVALFPDLEVFEVLLLVEELPFEDEEFLLVFGVPPLVFLELLLTADLVVDLLLGVVVEAFPLLVEAVVNLVLFEFLLDVAEILLAFTFPLAYGLL